MTDNMKEIKDLSDQIETTIDNNEVAKAHEVLNDPVKKQQVVDYLKKDEDKIAECVKQNLLETAELETKRDASPEANPRQTENPYKGAMHLYEKLFNVTITLGNGTFSIVENQPFIGPMPDMETTIANSADAQAAKEKIAAVVGGKKLDEAITEITNAKLNETKEDTGMTKQLKEHLKAGDYAAAFMDILNMVFFHNGEISFKELQGQGFVKLSEAELAGIYENGKDSNNPKIKELKDKITATANPNEKMAYAYLITQIEDYIAEHNAGKPLDDMDLLKPQLKKGSIILMCQEREKPNMLVNVGNAGIMTKDNNTIADFTHASIVTEDGADPMITHSTFKEGVHKQSLREYLGTFPRTNLLVLNPEDQQTGINIATKCDEYIGKKYDYTSGVAQFMSDVSVDTKLGKTVQDDKTKTNCVEFIADTLYGINSDKDLEDKSHPNDLLAATKSGYSLDYVKTYQRNKKAAVAAI